MAWDILETKDDVPSMRTALEDFESNAGVDTIDRIGSHRIGRNRIALFVQYTEAA